MKDVINEEGIVGKLILEVNLPSNMGNAMGNGHGGALATIIDEVTWAAVYAFTRKEIFTIKLLCEYLSPTYCGVDYQIEVSLNKVSKKLAFADAVIRDKETK